MAECEHDCWKCHWCWLGRCMDGSHYGQDVSVKEVQPHNCVNYISKEEWNRTHVAPMKQERCMELLNAVIDHLSVAERNKDVIQQLLRIGFTGEELITHFNFTKDDVEEASEDMEEDEE